MNGLITYDYICTVCGNRFARQFMMNQRPETVPCPECDEDSVRFMGRGAITPQVHFKGWNWSRKNLLDPESDDPRLDPLYFEDLMEKEGPTKHFNTKPA